MAWEYDELRIRLWSIGHGRYFVLANGSVCDSAVIDLPDALEFHAKLNDLLQEEFRRRPREKRAHQAKAASIGNGTLEPAIDRTRVPAELSKSQGVKKRSSVEVLLAAGTHGDSGGAPGDW